MALSCCLKVYSLLSCFMYCVCVGGGGGETRDNGLPLYSMYCTAWIAFLKKIYLQWNLLVNLSSYENYIQQSLQIIIAKNQLHVCMCLTLFYYRILQSSLIVSLMTSQLARVTSSCSVSSSCWTVKVNKMLRMLRGTWSS